MRLLLATHNDHKRREFERLLSGSPDVQIELDLLPETVLLPPEDGATFAENAAGKALAAAGDTRRVTIADDSGIAAAALDGAPGIRSARYAGERAGDGENLAKLRREVPVGSALEYICVISYVDPQAGIEQLFEGRCAGLMAQTPRGERGFGYDPVFMPDDGPEGLTMAELTDQQKDAISHRGRAARALIDWLTRGGAQAPLRAG